MPTLTLKISEAAMADLKREAQMVGLTLSELVRQKLHITPGQLVHAPEDRFAELDRRLARLEEMAGL